MLNDIGPFVASVTWSRSGAISASIWPSGTWREVEAHLRAIHAGFGQLTDEQWQHWRGQAAGPRPRGCACTTTRRSARRSWPTRRADIDLWPFWDAIRCPTLVLHGADSPLLTTDVIEEMQRRGPAIEVVNLPGIGHAPSLMVDDQIDTIVRWLGL